MITITKQSGVPFINYNASQYNDVLYAISGFYLIVLPDSFTFSTVTKIVPYKNYHINLEDQQSYLEVQFPKVNASDVLGCISKVDAYVHNIYNAGYDNDNGCFIIIHKNNVNYATQRLEETCDYLQNNAYKIYLAMQETKNWQTQIEYFLVIDEFPSAPVDVRKSIHLSDAAVLRYYVPFPITYWNWA